MRTVIPIAFRSNQQYPYGKPTNGKRSKFEEQVYQQALEDGVVLEYEKLKLNYTSVYNPDFQIPSNGIIVEVKGYFTPEDRAKMLKVIRDNPDLDIRFVFQANNKLSKNSQMRYSDWCFKHGIKFAFRKIPLEWTMEK